MRLRNVWIIVAAITLARLVYSIWLSPYELVADEAQYWDWSRHLDWSYYSKGPGIAWLIALATHTLGTAEWAIRAPAALSFAVVMAALALLTADAPGPILAADRAATVVPLIVTLVPAYQLMALVMTIDPPALACWALGLYAAWCVYRQERGSRPRYGPWIGLGLTIGVGFLFKYTDLLIVPGLLAFAWMQRGEVSWPRARARALTCGLVAVATMMPVIVWNVQHASAGMSHLLGYLYATGGDRPAVQRGLSVGSMIEYPIVQLAVIGPMIGLAVAGAKSLRQRAADSYSLSFVRFSWCTAAPMLLFFLAASSRTRIQGNWPLAAFLSLVPLAAIAISRQVASKWQVATIVCGFISLFAIHAPLTAARVPAVGRFVPISRFHGTRAAVSQLSEGVRRFLDQSSGRGLIVAISHNEAGLLAYYLPGQPIVASAGRFLGNRPSAYDFFTATNLDNPALTGRPTLFIGGRYEMWSSVFKADNLTMVDTHGPQFVATAFAR